MIEKYISQVEVKDPTIRVNQIKYLDYEIEEKEYPEYSELSLVPKMFTVELEKLKFTASQTSELEKILMVNHEIDPRSLTEEILINEMIISNQKGIIKEIREIAKEYINFRDIRWWNQIFGKWNPPVKYKNIIKDLAVAANLISRSSKKGPGNFIIISNSDVIILEGLNKFTYINNDDEKFSQGETYILGNLMGMDVIIDPYAEGGSLIVGRKATETDGVISINSENEFQEIEGIEDTLYMLSKMSKITSVPNAGDNYIKIQLDCIRYPFIKHIWTQIKSIFK